MARCRRGLQIFEINFSTKLILLKKKYHIKSSRTLAFCDYEILVYRVMVLLKIRFYENPAAYHIYLLQPEFQGQRQKLISALT